MLNQIVLVGRLTKKPEIVEGKDYCILTIAVPRSFKNEDGIYETDFIDCVAYKSVAKNTCEWCDKGDLLGIKGRLQKINDNPHPAVVVERVTFLSSRANEINKEMEEE